jgi:hypothetical protein
MTLNFPEMLTVNEIENGIAQCQYVQSQSRIDFKAVLRREYYDKSESLTYYPRVTYIISLHQSPNSYMIGVFFPAVIISLFNYIMYFEKYL